jgi:hypothetical protein
MRKLNTFGITSCIYINEEQFANYLIVKKTNNECNCDSFQLFWQGHADSCFYCRKK